MHYSNQTRWCGETPGAESCSWAPPTLSEDPKATGTALQVSTRVGMHTDPGDRVGRAQAQKDKRGSVTICPRAF